MNAFRILGDGCHLVAIAFLLAKICWSRSCSGISGKTQVLLALVFTTRYMDMLSNFVSIYNSVMKALFLMATHSTVYLIYITFRSTYNRSYDIFRIELIIGLSAVLALIFNHDFTPLELLWTFSIYLEALAILPQLLMIAVQGRADKSINFYLLALGCYRALYLPNWVYRYCSESHYDAIAVVAGVIQTLFFLDYFTGNHVVAYIGLKVSTHNPPVVTVVPEKLLDVVQTSEVGSGQTENTNHVPFKINMIVDLPETHIPLNKKGSEQLPSA